MLTGSGLVQSATESGNRKTTRPVHTQCDHNSGTHTVNTLADPGVPRAAAPLEPKIFSKSCSFQAILNKCLSQGPPHGVKTPLALAPATHYAS